MKLNYKQFGTGEPLFIFHGLMGMLDNWQGPAKAFSSRFSVFIVDLRNHGHSPHHPDHNYDVMVDDVIELFDDLSVDSAHVLGHSMGGKMVMHMAQLHPERVQKLIVADIAPKFYPVHHQDILAGLKNVDFNTLERRSEAEPALAEYIDESGVRQFLMKSLYRPERNRFAWRFNLEAIENNIELVGEPTDDMDFSGETLFVRGGNSRYVLDDDWADIKVLFPNSQLETIEGAGHWLHAEKPEAFVEAVSRFLG